MAKRRRLDPVAFLAGGQDLDGDNDLSRAKGLAPPIAQAAGEAAATAALDEVAAALGAAREEGRLILRLPLGAVEAGYLARDRLMADADLSRAKGRDGRGRGAEAMAELEASLKARGQRAPIEVDELPPDTQGAPHWGLVSGWRRLMALRALHAETGEERFATILALVRRPSTAADAYVAMVEENEVRENLSFWERARIVRRAVGAGAFADETQALRSLFAAASYARRSKIKSFLPVVTALDGVLAFPEAIGERLGLALARALSVDPGFVASVRQILGTAAPRDAAAEVGLLADLLAMREEGGVETMGGPPSEEVIGTPPSPSPQHSPTEPGQADGRAGETRLVRNGLRLRATRGRIEITGSDVTPDLVDRIEAWLRAAS